MSSSMLRHGASHKRGPNPGYVSLQEKRLIEEAKSPPVPKTKNLFRGLISGSAFMTAKGNRGTMIDSLWGQHIFMSLNNDDVELLEIAMKSSLADLTEVVVGGDHGSPFILGDLGFYSENILSGQSKLLQTLERDLAVGKYFLSAKEWSDVDEKLSAIGHFSNALVRRAVRGDTFGALALRANAFLVARKMMDNGVDPLLENDEGEDLIGILQEQYGYVSDKLHHAMARKEETQHRVFADSEMEEIEREEKHVVDTLTNMLSFVDSLVQVIDRRLVLIHHDRQAKRRAEMRKETLPAYNLWNANQLEKATKHLKVCEDVKNYIHERLDVYEKTSRHTISLADLVVLQHAQTLDEKSQNASAALSEKVLRISNKLSLKHSASGQAGPAPSAGALAKMGADKLQEEEEKALQEEETKEERAHSHVAASSPTGAIIGILRKNSRETISYR